VAERHDATLVEVLLQRRACVFRFELRSGVQVDLLLTARSDAHALARSASFNLQYRNIKGDMTAPGVKEALAALVKDAVRTVIERDPGGMHLDQRKGLVGPEAFRRKPASKQRPKGLRVLG
jgi:hypothetical protein